MCTFGDADGPHPYKMGRHLTSAVFTRQYSPLRTAVAGNLGQFAHGFGVGLLNRRPAKHAGECYHGNGEKAPKPLKNSFIFISVV